MAIDETAPYGARASMELAGYTLELRVGDDDRRVTIVNESFVGASDEAVDVECAHDDETLSIAIVAKQRMFVESCRVFLRHAQTSDDMVMMNGYQSCTDTAEHPAWARMRGLWGVPEKAIDTLALDTAGDYRFVHYEPRGGNLHGFTYATFRRDEGVVLVGSLDESHGFTLIRSNARQGLVALETEAPRRMVEAGERIVLGSYAITRGTSAQAHARWAELAGMKARPASPLIGYTSLHNPFETTDEKGLADQLAAMVHALGVGGANVGVLAQDMANYLGCNLEELHVPQPVFLIDGGYCTMGDWLSPDPARFEAGLGPLASTIRAFGFIPGLRIDPFACATDSAIAKEHSEWVLRDEFGEDVRIATQEGEAFALDSRNAEVRSYVLEVLQTAVQVWGFGLMKLDSLFAACLVERDGMNRGELMADAISLLRQGAGDECLIIAAGVPLGSAFGKVDYCQVACDVLPGVSAVPFRFLTQRERPSAKNNLDAVYARGQLDGLAFGNDPGVVYLRPGASITESVRDERLFAVADLSSVLLTSDDVSTWSDEERGRYVEALKVMMARGVE